MPYTTVVAGTTITATWANANVRDQGVTPFASAAARTSAITTPVAGMVTVLTDTDRVDFRTSAGAWRRLLDETMAKGLVYAKRKTDNGDLAAGFTTETTFFSKTVTVEPNRVYDIATVCPIFAQNANSLVRVRIKEGSTQLSESGPTALPAGGSTTAVRVSYRYTTGAAQTSLTITVTGELTAGGGTATCRGWSSMPFEFSVHDVTGQTSLVEA